MGKRRGGLSGLSRFLESFNTDPAPSQTLSTPTHDLDDSDRPKKKQKKIQGIDINDAKSGHCEELESESFTAVSPQWIQKYDATGLVPHYSHPSQVPPYLQKYFSQRARLFSQYSTPPGCLLDEEGWFSVTPERIANQIAERCRCDTVLDAFCGVGGNAIAFAKTCERVIALDTSPTRLALARHNAQIYGVAHRIEFVLADYIAFANAYISLPSSSLHSPNTRKIDVVFLSPPWGGPSYLLPTPPSDSSPSTPLPPPQSSTSGQQPSPATASAPSYYSLASIQPIHGAELWRISRRITQNVAYYLPRNLMLEEVAGLLTDTMSKNINSNSNDSKSNISNTENEATFPSAAAENRQETDMEMVEVEEEWMGTKLKAVTCYFGGLVNGQSGLF